MNTLLKLTLIGAALAAAPAFAQDGTVTLSETSNGGETPAIDAAPASGGRYAIKYAARPLTLSKMTLRAEADFLFPRLVDFGVGLRVGAAFGITDDLEVGATILPLALSPNAGYGDIPVYGRFRFLKGNFEVGAQLALNIPTSTDFGLTPGLVAVLHSNNFRLDVGLNFDVRFSDPDAITSLLIPITASLNFSDNFWAQIRTGINVPNFDGLVVPLGIGGFYTIAKGDVPMLDVGATFDFPSYIQTIGGDALVLDYFVIGLAARFHLFL